jgi:hypothetical protein
MTKAPTWKIRYYVSEDETKPFEAFIMRLETLEERAECAALIELLRLRGDKSSDHQPLTHNNHWRVLRGNEVRIFYICEDDTVVIIDGRLHGEDDELFHDI